MGMKQGVRRDGRGQPTMRQVALKAGVSATTVAHVLNNTEGTYVAQETRERVLEASRALGYQTSLISRSIKDPLKHLGIAIADTATFANPVDVAQICDGIQAEATRHDYLSVVRPMSLEVAKGGAREAVEAMVQLHQAKLIDGFVLDKSCFITTAVQELVTKKVPVVTLNGITTFEEQTNRPIPAVNIDNFHGGRLATQHLLELGHRRIAMISRPYSKYARGYRPHQVTLIREGYAAAMLEAGAVVRPTLVTEGDPYDKERTYEVVRALFAGPDRPTAVFVADDAIAVMTCHALARLGLDVPGDVSVVSYGGTSQAAHLAEPSLTTVHAPLRENGVQAARYLIQLLEGGVTAEHRWITPTLHVAESTAAT